MGNQQTKASFLRHKYSMGLDMVTIKIQSIARTRAGYHDVVERPRRTTNPTDAGTISHTAVEYASPR